MTPLDDMALGVLAHFGMLAKDASLILFMMNKNVAPGSPKFIHAKLRSLSANDGLAAVEIHQKVDAGKT